MPTTVKSSSCTSRPSSRKWRLTDSQAPLRRDAHLLVVVAARAARGERVAEPEAVVVGHARWRRRRAPPCPCRPPPPGRGRPRRSARRRGGGSISPPTMLSVRSSSPRDEDAVAGLDLGQQLVAVVARRRALDDEAALGAHRHDHRVLDHLRLHQPEHLGAEVLAPVRPADAAAGHLAAAQVHALGARRVHEDLEARPRQRQPGKLLRVELERQVAACARRRRRAGRSSCAAWRARRRGSCAGCGPGRGSRPRRSPPRSRSTSRSAASGSAASGSKRASTRSTQQPRHAPGGRRAPAPRSGR